MWGVRAVAERAGEAGNEAGVAKEELETVLNKAWSSADAEARREVMVRIEEIMQEEGVTIQPYWRSLYRHYRDGIIGAEKHPTFEIHLYKLGLAA